MATTSCPNCGKPLRPGARFCGSCGHTIPAVPSAQPGASPAGPDTIACPQCGKPVRVGAKFCSNCGKVLQQEPTIRATLVPQAPSVPPALPEEKPVSLPRLKPAAQPQAVEAPVAAQAVVASAARDAAPSPSKAGPGRKTIWPLIILVFVLTCGLVGSAAYVYLKDPFGWLTTTKASPTASVPSQTPEPAPTTTATNVELSTQNPPNPTLTVPTLTVAVVPAITVTLSATLEVTPSIPLTTVVPVTGTTQLAAPTILLNDYFNDPLNINWKAWGSPRPILRSGPGNNWLDLTATDKPETAGVTTRMEVTNSPGSVIEFEGQLNPNYANFPLFFDWDPLQFDRGPENITLTVLHLAIQNNRIVLQAPAANNTCQKESKGAQQHRYVLKFIGDKQVALYIDESEQAICQLDLGIMAIPGRISFTGTGWVSHVLVTGSNPP